MWGYCYFYGHGRHLNHRSGCGYYANKCKKPDGTGTEVGRPG